MSLISLTPSLFIILSPRLLEHFFEPLTKLVATESSSHDPLWFLWCALMINSKLIMNMTNRLRTNIKPSVVGLSRLLKFIIGIFNTEKDGNLDEFKHPR